MAVLALGLTLQTLLITYQGSAIPSLNLVSAYKSAENAYKSSLGPFYLIILSTELFYLFSSDKPTSSFFQAVRI